MSDPDTTQQLRSEAMAVGRFTLAEEDYNLTRAIYRVYLHYREHFLREYKLMDTTPYTTNPEIARRWQQAKSDARSLATSVQQCWASEIIRAHKSTHQRAAQLAETSAPTFSTRRPTSKTVRPDLSPAATADLDQLPQAARDYAINRLHANAGDIPETLHALKEHLREHLRDKGDQYEAAEAHAQALANDINSRWAAAITDNYDRLRRQRTHNGSAARR